MGALFRGPAACPGRPSAGTGRGIDQTFRITQDAKPFNTLTASGPTAKTVAGGLRATHLAFRCRPHPSVPCSPSASSASTAAVRGRNGSHGVFRLGYDAGSKLGAAAMAVLRTTIVLVVGPLAPPGSAPPGARDTRNGSPLGPVVQAARLAPAGPRSPRHPARPWSSR